MAELAGLNVGVVSVIWVINPALLATAEYFTLGTIPLINHLVGTLLLIICTILISLSKPIKTDSLTPVVVQPYIPVILSISVSVF